MVPTSFLARQNTKSMSRYTFRSDSMYGKDALVFSSAMYGTCNSSRWTLSAGVNCCVRTKKKRRSCFVSQYAGRDRSIAAGFCLSPMLGVRRFGAIMSRLAMFELALRADRDQFLPIAVHLRRAMQSRRLCVLANARKKAASRKARCGGVLRQSTAHTRRRAQVIGAPRYTI